MNLPKKIFLFLFWISLVSATPNTRTSSLHKQQYFTTRTTRKVHLPISISPSPPLPKITTQDTIIGNGGGDARIDCANTDKPYASIVTNSLRAGVLKKHRFV